MSFNFNDINSIKEKIIGNENNIAAIILEPARTEMASLEFLEELRNLADEIGAVLIFDEITSGLDHVPVAFIDKIISNLTWQFLQSL